MSSEARSSLSAPAAIRSYAIAANDGGKTAQMVGGIIKLQYFESLLSDTISTEIMYIDTGGAVDGKTVLDGLPLVGGEKSQFSVSDNKDNLLQATLYVNNITPLSDDTHGQVIMISSVSKEVLLNDKIRLYEKFKGKISESVKKILTNGEYLGTEKNISGIDDTFEDEYNFMGNAKKPFYTINWLSKKAIPATSGEGDSASGNTAGFFFWETSEGYYFKSIDTLLEQSPKKYIIYNDTPDDCGKKVPEGYDIKALSFSKDNIQTVDDKQKIGARDTRMCTFDPFTGVYIVSTKNSDQTEKSLSMGGKKLPNQNPELIRPGENKNFSRTTCVIKDTGSLPSGNTEQQLDKSKQENFKVEKVLNQSIMRYNQFFSFKAEVVIPGDFSLHAGDAVYIDSPQQKDTNTDEMNEQSGGLYIITELCHYLDLNGTYTKLLLVRDSVERKPKTR